MKNTIHYTVPDSIGEGNYYDPADNTPCCTFGHLYDQTLCYLRTNVDPSILEGAIDLNQYAEEADEAIGFFQFDQLYTDCTPDVPANRFGGITLATRNDALPPEDRLVAFEEFITRYDSVIYEEITKAIINQHNEDKANYLNPADILTARDLLD